MNTQKTGIIYRATSPSGKVYIGQTTSLLKSRIQEHTYAAKTGHSKFKTAIKKYGADNLKWEIIHKNVPFGYLKDLEIEEIKNHDSFYNGYNNTLGGEFIPESARKKLSYSTTTLFFDKKRKGVPCKEETKKKLSEIHKGREILWKDKISQTRIEKRLAKKENNPMYGKKHSEDSKKKMSAAGQGLHIGELNGRAKLTPEQVILLRQLKKEGWSYKELQNAFKISPATTWRVISEKSWKGVGGQNVQ